MTFEEVFDRIAQRFGQDGEDNRPHMDPELYLVVRDAIVSGEAVRKLVRAQIAKKFGELSPLMQDQIKRLSGEEVEWLAFAFLDMKDREEVQSWLNKRFETSNAE